MTVIVPCWNLELFPYLNSLYQVQNVLTFALYPNSSDLLLSYNTIFPKDLKKDTRSIQSQ